MLPETCDPTWTVITALIVPVASTTSLISPRSTFAVKCCACVLRFNPKATNRPAASTTPAMISHRPVLFMHRSYSQNAKMLFVAQSFNGIEQRSLARRVVSKKYADSNGKKRRNHNGFGRHLDRPLKRLANQIRPKDPE